MLKTMLMVGVVMGAVSTCSTPAQDESDPSPSPDASSTTTSQSDPSVAPPPNNSSREELDPSKLDLLYVRTTAPDCVQVWSPGAQLPANYQWCSDEGDPVAGVRIGPCEVVVHKDEMYAIPGREIASVTAGDISQDQGFLRARTSCKRRPAPARGN